MSGPILRPRKTKKTSKSSDVFYYGSLDAGELHNIFVAGHLVHQQPYYDETASQAQWDGNEYVTRVSSESDIISCKMCGCVLLTHSDLAVHARLRHESAYNLHIQLQAGEIAEQIIDGVKRQLSRTFASGTNGIVSVCGSRELYSYMFVGKGGNTKTSQLNDKMTTIFRGSGEDIEGICLAFVVQGVLILY